MTFRELKAALELMSEEQLNYEVHWCGEDRGGKVGSVWVVDEDQINPSGDGMEPVSTYADKPEYVQDEPIVAHKGQPLLMVDL